MQHEVTHSIHAEEIYQIIRIDHISLGFAHLAIAHQKPGMSEYLLRQGLTQRHQENRPVNRMETDNVLSDQMQVCGPVLSYTARCCLPSAVIADTGDIVGQRIQPYINHMLGIKVYRDAPVKGGSGYAQILQSRKQEVVHHLVLYGKPAE